MNMPLSDFCQQEQERYGPDYIVIQHPRQPNRCTTVDRVIHHGDGSMTIAGCHVPANLVKRGPRAWSRMVRAHKAAYCRRRTEEVMGRVRAEVAA